MPPFYFRKLTCWTLRLSLGWNLVVLGLERKTIDLEKTIRFFYDSVSAISI